MLYAIGVAAISEIIFRVGERHREKFNLNVLRARKKIAEDLGLRPKELYIDDYADEKMEE